MTESQFNALLEDTRVAFDKSEVKQRAKEEGKEWYYSVSFLREHMLASELLGSPEREVIEYQKGETNSSCIVVKGTYALNGLEIPVYLLPHPNNRLRDEVRRQAWDFCFRDT